MADTSNTVLWAVLAAALAVFAAAAWAAWVVFGPVALVLLAPVFAALATPLVMKLASGTVRAARAHALAPLEGKHFAFRDHAVAVIEDDDGQRWTRAQDVRRILATGTSDSALARTYGEGFRVMGTPPAGYLNEAALLAHLGRQPSLLAAKMRAWAERDIVAPARGKRGQRR
jgi:hypothetical protein